MGAFDWLDERNARQLIGEINDYVMERREREEAAERRHNELLGIIGSVASAVAAGLRVTADALDQINRRRR